MKTKFTPGPWTIKRGGNGDACSVSPVLQWRGLRSANREANARLIAAAPELYQALRECADRLQIHMKHTEDLVAHMAAVKALTKAEGGQ